MYEIGKYYRDKVSGDIMRLTSITVGSYFEQDDRIHHFVELVFSLLKRTWTFECKRIREEFFPYKTKEEKAIVIAFLQRLLAVQLLNGGPQESSLEPLTPDPPELATECTTVAGPQIPTEVPGCHGQLPLSRSCVEEPNGLAGQEDPSQ